MREGKMDAVYPMLYYNEAEFNEYVEDWLKVSNGRFVVPGLGVYRLLPEEGDWSLDNIKQQMDWGESDSVSGGAFYRTGNLLDNTKGILDLLKTSYYKYPAKVPPMTWLASTPPPAPVHMRVYRNQDGLVVIEWEASDKSEEQTYTVYECDTDNVDTSDARNIVMTGIRDNKIYLNASPLERGVYFTVTASDPYRNESRPATSAFFVLSSTLEK